MSRLRQAVIAVGNLDEAVGLLRSEPGLKEPFTDPAVEYFGLKNAVFAIGDTFLEILSPIREGTAAGRQLERRGGDCGYMAMLEVEDVAAARERARRLGIREVFDVEFDDISEAHLHPADIGGAIVSVSEPRPPGSWRWGGPDWQSRSIPGSLLGLKVAVADPGEVGQRWREVAGGPLPVEFVADPEGPGIIEVELEIKESRLALSPRDLSLSEARPPRIPRIGAGTSRRSGLWSGD